MFAALRLLRLARPLIAALRGGKDFATLLPILSALLPEVIKLLGDDKNREIARRNVERPETNARQDLEDTWKDGDFGWTD